MRVIVYGVGAIGGTIAAAVALSGQEVVGIARGAQLDAIQRGGLLLRTPERTARAQFPCVSDSSEIDLRSDDFILLTMKTQDTLAA
jgi:2-dehydropantoate 2-reductase